MRRILRLIGTRLKAPKTKSFNLALPQLRYNYSRLVMDNQLDEKLEEQKTVQALTAKELKKLIKPEFEKNPDKYYPTETLRDKLGFTRLKCEKSGTYFWSKDPNRKTCGDGGLTGKYDFINSGGIGIGKEKTVTIGDTWESFKKSLSTCQTPCTPIKRYPVVARWRNDVDYVIAGIFCFQPYCVTGELDPPANPLIMPQFCVRFNDLDNIGVTGRHYSGFVMLGIQAFNKEGDQKMWKDDCVQANYDWLTKELKIDPMDITFTEDIWAGGGNVGPCIEYFVKGMEIGNMVFMQYKSFHDGSIEELPIKVIDVGIGMERIPWLLNGTPTSYPNVFPKAFEYLTKKLDISMDNEIWAKLGPYTATLDVDECEDIEKAWKDVAELVGEPLDKIKKAIEPIRDIIIILDHTRTLLMTITDGSLPSNVGGGGNLRNILRRTFAIMKKNEWWSKMSFDEYLQVYEQHKKDLEGLYGEFKPYSSFNKIIEIEHERWLTTEGDQRSKLDKLLKKKAKLTIDDWIIAITSWGIPADAVAQISNSEIPSNLYHEMATRQERVVKAAEQILYNTTHLQPTKNLYYENHHLYSFEAKIVDVFQNVKQKSSPANILILSQSAFYPTSGGQLHDSGKIVVEGEEYEVLDVEKVGQCVLHVLDRELTKPKEELIGKDVKCSIDFEVRNQLRNHHTACHIVFAAARKILGPHVWQQGAKKTTTQAHLDITHYSGIEKAELLKIQDAANRIVMSGKKINKSLVPKAEAEKEHGFSLYQGGVVPGNELRIVNIEDTDVEACCGTHCDSTNEVGWIKIRLAKKIADGIVRLYFVAGERTFECLNEETMIISDLTKMWNISMDKLVPTADRFFKESKKYSGELAEKQKSSLVLEVKYVSHVPSVTKAIILSKEENPTLYFSLLESHAALLKVDLDNSRTTTKLWFMLEKPSFMDLLAMLLLLIWKN